MRSLHVLSISRRPGSLVRESGFSIAVILAAVALMAALSVAVLLGSRTNNAGGTSDTEAHNRILAATLIDQARNLKVWIENMTAKGIAISSITFDTSGTAGLFNPSIGGAEPQVPAPEMMWTATDTWVWKVDSNGNPVVKLYNVGINSNADYVIALPRVALETCWSINIILHNYGPLYGYSMPQLSAGTQTDWETPGNAIDLSAPTSGTQGWREGCYLSSDGNAYVYVVTVRAQ